jgi:hypothetical protein
VTFRRGKVVRLPHGECIPNGWSEPSP